MKCERCGRPLDESNQGADENKHWHRLNLGDFPICYPCAKELTLIVGYWLGTRPMKDPVKWFTGLPSAT